MNASAARRIGAGVLGLLAGFASGTLGTFTHQFGVSAVTQAGLPIGLVLGLLLVGGLVLALRLLAVSRLPSVGAALGVVAAIALFSQPSPGGSAIVLQSWVGITWEIAPAVLAALLVALPRIQRRPKPVWDTGDGPPGRTPLP